jgi:uncharacterized protein YxjI
VRYVMREKIFAIGDDFTVKDDQGNDRFVVDGKVFSLGHKMIIRDMSGNEAATVHQDLLSLRHSYVITRGGKEIAEVKKKLLSVLHERFIVDTHGAGDLEITGSILEHNYSFARGDTAVAVVSKPWIELRDSYGVEIADGENDVMILACTIVIDLFAQEHEKHD